MLPMTPRSIGLLAATAVIMWVVPSIGTRGMGTIGQRITHADAMLFDTDSAAREAASAALARADAAAEAAAGL